MRGGFRLGAGRKKGSVSKRRREIAENAVLNGLTPLEFMLSVVRNEKASMADRMAMAMAMAAAPYVHVKLASAPPREQIPQVYVQTINVVGIPSGTFLSADEIDGYARQTLIEDDTAVNGELTSPWVPSDNPDPPPA